MNYFIYTRKSTDSEERQVLSIGARLVELKEFAAKEKLEIGASLCKAKTAKEPEKILAQTSLFGQKLRVRLFKTILCRQLQRLPRVLVFL